MSDWDVSAVTDFSYLFGSPYDDADSIMPHTEYAAHAHHHAARVHWNIPSLNSWDVSNGTAFRYTFCGVVYAHTLGDWNVSNATTMKGMFDSALISNSLIERWNVGQVTDTSFMFKYNVSFNDPIGVWNVGHVLTMVGMFDGAESFNQSLNDWDVSACTDMTMMFSDCPMNQPLDKWDVGQVTSMFHMFQNTSFNHPIDDWNVSQVIDMSAMFMFNEVFEQNVSKWNVANVLNFDDMFWGASKFVASSLEAWADRVRPYAKIIDMFGGDENAAPPIEPLPAWWKKMAKLQKLSLPVAAATTTSLDGIILEDAVGRDMITYEEANVLEYLAEDTAEHMVFRQGVEDYYFARRSDLLARLKNPDHIMYGCLRVNTRNMPPRKRHVDKKSKRYMNIAHLGIGVGLVPLGQLVTMLTDYPQMRAARMVSSGERLLAVTSKRLADNANANVGSANRCQEGSGTVVLNLQLLGIPA